MTPRVWIFTISYNEAVMMPFFLRHYSTFAEKIIVWDEHSTDGTRDIIKACPKAELRDWPWKGLDDNRFLKAVNCWYREARNYADWVMWPDPDELLYAPNPLDILGNAKADILQATGYALISPQQKMPVPIRQIYEQIGTGHRLENYDKAIIWRPEIDIEHTHGRHTYPGWPKGGKVAQSSFKLLHCHCMTEQYTRERNARNYARAVDKRFAWNYDSQHNGDPSQNSSLAWVQVIIKNNRLEQLFHVEKLKMVQFCCGDNHLPDWENRDMDCDITKPLPYASASVDRIFIEHGLEHVTPQQAWSFLEECHRILVKGGILRVAIPDLARMWITMTPAYAAIAGGSPKEAIRSAIFNHGHQGAWTEELIWVVLNAIGFSHIEHCEMGKSKQPELRNIEGHGKVVGEHITAVETSIVEATK